MAEQKFPPASGLSPKPKVRLRAEPLSVVSLVLAFLVMIWPTGADMLVSMLRYRGHAEARVFAAICFVVVLTPFLLSWRRLRRHPGKWRGYGYLAITGVILALNILMVGSLLYGGGHK